MEKLSLYSTTVYFTIVFHKYIIKLLYNCVHRKIFKYILIYADNITFLISNLETILSSFANQNKEQINFASG